MICIIYLLSKWNFGRNIFIMYSGCIFSNNFSTGWCIVWTLIWCNFVLRVLIDSRLLSPIWKWPLWALTLWSLRVINILFLPTISPLNHTLKSGEWSKWSPTDEALDCWKNSPYQHLRKCLKNSMENMHTDVREKRVTSNPFKPQHLYLYSPYSSLYISLGMDKENLFWNQSS